MRRPARPIGATIRPRPLRADARRVRRWLERLGRGAPEHPGNHAAHRHLDAENEATGTDDRRRTSTSTKTSTAARAAEPPNRPARANPAAPREEPPAAATTGESSSSGGSGESSSGGGGTSAGGGGSRGRLRGRRLGILAWELGRQQPHRGRRSTLGPRRALGARSAFGLSGRGDQRRAVGQAGGAVEAVVLHAGPDWSASSGRSCSCTGFAAGWRARRFVGEAERQRRGPGGDGERDDVALLDGDRGGERELGGLAEVRFELARAGSARSACR